MNYCTGVKYVQPVGIPLTLSKVKYGDCVSGLTSQITVPLAAVSLNQLSKLVVLTFVVASILTELRVVHL